MLSHPDDLPLPHLFEVPEEGGCARLADVALGPRRRLLSLHTRIPHDEHLIVTDGEEFIEMRRESDTFHAAHMAVEFNRGTLLTPNVPYDNRAIVTPRVQQFLLRVPRERLYSVRVAFQHGDRFQSFTCEFHDVDFPAPIPHERVARVSVELYARAHRVRREAAETCACVGVVPLETFVVAATQ